MVYFKETSIKALNEQGDAQNPAQGGTSAEDKARIAQLEQEVADLTAAIERGLTV